MRGPGWLVAATLLVIAIAAGRKHTSNTCFFHTSHGMFISAVREYDVRPVADKATACQIYSKK